MLINLDPLWGFFEILHSERYQEVHGNYINSCAILDPKLYCVLKVPDALERFFKILHNEKGQEAYTMLCPQNSGSALKDLFVILYNERDEDAPKNLMVFCKQQMVFNLLWLFYLLLY